MESWKRKRNDGEVKIEKEGSTTSGEALASMGGVAEVIPKVPVTYPEANIPTERIVVAPTTPMDVKVMEMTLVVVSPTVPTIAKEEEM